MGPHRRKAQIANLLYRSFAICRGQNTADWPSSSVSVTTSCGSPIPNRRYSRFKFCAAFLALVTSVLLAPSAQACAACYGQSDAPMAQGMNWGIMSLLAIIVTMLSGVASFFIYLARRSAAPSHAPPNSLSPEPQPQTT